MTMMKDLGFTHAVQANADLSAEANLHKLVKLDTAGAVGLGSSADPCFGTLIELHPNNAPAGDRAVTVQFGGIGKVKLGGTVNAGGGIMSGASGVGVALTSTSFCVGYALAGGVSGDVIPFYFAPHDGSVT